MVHSLGFDVFTTLLAHEPREHLIDEGIHASTADVTKDTDIVSLKETISSETSGNLDVLVNCAYVESPFPLVEFRTKIQDH
jgi:NAD(P)-dependent dehydrogenase (short-subunit alcohol dehydrogenase family)